MRLAAETRRILAQYRWPGNVLELVSVLERAVVLTSGDTIAPSDLPERLLRPAAGGSPTEAPSPILTLEAVEREHIQVAIAQCGTLEEAAVRLGIDPATLWRKRKRYGLS
jgi:NtrC-family two-component system response regulator AlgB